MSRPLGALQCLKQAQTAGGIMGTNFHSAGSRRLSEGIAGDAPAPETGAGQGWVVPVPTGNGQSQYASPQSLIESQTSMMSGLSAAEGTGGQGSLFSMDQALPCKMRGVTLTKEHRTHAVLLPGAAVGQVCLQAPAMPADWHTPSCSLAALVGSLGVRAAEPVTCGLC